MHEYPSDISREEYALIREDLEGAKKRTRPRKYDLYDVFCAVLYVIQGGIQWRMLLSAPVIKCKKTPRKKCRFMAEEAKKR